MLSRNQLYKLTMHIMHVVLQLTTEYTDLPWNIRLHQKNEPNMIAKQQMSKAIWSHSSQLTVIIFH